MRLTVAQALLMKDLPPELRYVVKGGLDKKKIKQIFSILAKHANRKLLQGKDLQFLPNLSSLSNLSSAFIKSGIRIAHEGGLSLGISDLSRVPEADNITNKIKQEVLMILSDNTLTDEEKESKIIDVILKYADQMTEDVLNRTERDGSRAFYYVVSGARGNPVSLRSLRGADLVYQDYRGRPIPIPILRGFSQGISPAEFWANTYGARRGMMAEKLGTADAGYLAKQLNQIVHRVVVSKKDVDDETYGKRGLLVDVDDPDNEGALLAFPVDKYPRNTVLTPDILADLKAKGIKKIVIRSPLVYQEPDMTVTAADAGIREKGDFPKIGEFIGIAAAQSISERLSQTQLSTKHTGGVLSKNELSANLFQLIDQLFQQPKNFLSAAIHATEDGKVEKIEPNELGGWDVYINGKRHFVPSTHRLTVKVGDDVEAGQRITLGIPNLRVVAKYRGVGEARREFLEGLRELVRAAGIGSSRRNLELIAPAFVGYVKLNTRLGPYYPGDVIWYSQLEKYWQIRDGAKELPVNKAIGKYLEVPVLHYTIGTRITPSIAKTLKEAGIETVTAHPEPPDFEPEIVRAADYLANDPDWLTRMFGQNLKRTFVKSVYEGGYSDEAGSSFVPALARGIPFGTKPPLVPPEKDLQPYSPK